MIDDPMVIHVARFSNNVHSTDGRAPSVAAILRTLARLTPRDVLATAMGLADVEPGAHPVIERDGARVRVAAISLGRAERLGARRGRSLAEGAPPSS